MQYMRESETDLAMSRLKTMPLLHSLMKSRGRRRLYTWRSYGACESRWDSEFEKVDVDSACAKEKEASYERRAR